MSAAMAGGPPIDAVARALAPLDRRAFLRLAGTAAVAGVALELAGCGGAGDLPAELVPPEAHALRTFTPRAYATFQAAALRLVGPRAAGAVRERRLDPAAAADAWLARLPELAPLLGRALWVLEWGIWPLLPKLRPFTALSGPAQDRVLEDLMRSRLDAKRDLFKGLKSLAMLATWAQPAARPLVGHPGPFDAAGIAAAMS